MAAEHVARIGQRIRERREEQGLTQRELADLIPGKSDGNQVSKWERGEHRVSDDTLEQIAAILDVDVSYFMVPPATAAVPDLADVFAVGEPSQLDRIEQKLGELTDLVNRELVEREIERNVARDEASKSASATKRRARRKGDQ